MAVMVAVGGDVILEVKPTLNTLYAFRRKKKFVAEDGKNGGVNNQTGAFSATIDHHCSTRNHDLWRRWITYR